MDVTGPSSGSASDRLEPATPDARALATWALLGLSGVDRSELTRRTGPGYDVVNVVDGRCWAVDVPDGALWWIDSEIRVVGDLPPAARHITHSLAQSLWQHLPGWLHQISMEPEAIRLSEMQRYGQEVGLHPRLLTDLERGMPELLRLIS